MASNADFVQYVADQCSGAGEIVAKKMFGDYGIYCNGKIFGLICDDRFYLKPTTPVRTMLREEILLPPYEGAKDYFYIADVDDRDYLSALVSETRFLLSFCHSCCCVNTVERRHLNCSN